MCDRDVANVCSRTNMGFVTDSEAFLNADIVGL